MRILISTSVFPPDIGGPATYVPDLAQNLVKQGHTVYVLTSSDVEKHRDDNLYPFSVYRVTRQSRITRMIVLTLMTIKLARYSDIIFVNGNFIEAVIATKIIRKPLVFKVVGDWIWERCVNAGLVKDKIDDFQQNQYTWKIGYQKWLRNWVTQQANAIIVPSNYLKKIVVNWNIRPEKISVIYNASHLPTEQDIAEAESFKGYTIITVARLVAWKGIDRLIRVLANIPCTRLMIIGDGPIKNELEKLTSALDLQTRVTFVGRVNRAKVLAYLKSADLFVLNSTYEGLPHVIVEAMQAQIPVIATNVGGTHELIEDMVNGRLIPAEDDLALYNAITELLTNADLCDSLVKNAYITVSTQLSWQTMIQETRNLLQDMVAMHTRKLD